MVREHTECARLLLNAGAKNTIVRTPRPFRELPRKLDVRPPPRVQQMLPRPTSFQKLDAAFAATRPQLLAQMESIKWRKPPKQVHRTAPSAPATDVAARGQMARGHGQADATPQGATRSRPTLEQDAAARVQAMRRGQQARREVQVEVAAREAATVLVCPT